MALDFPSEPKVGQTHYTAGTKYTWTGDRWMGRAYSLSIPYPIYTTDVLVAEEESPGLRADPTDLKTQRDINHYLHGSAGSEDYATKDELAALQAQVDNLSGLMIQARYEQGTGITTRPGQFVCVANDTQQNRFSQGAELRLYETDLDQKAPALTRVIIGDYINIVEPTTGLSCQLHVTQSMGVVIKYDYMIGTLDRISDRVPYQFRISGTA